MRTDINLSSDKINYKIRQFSHAKVPMIVVIGAKEQETGQLTIRHFGSNEQVTMTKEQLIDMVKQENKKYFTIKERAGR